MQIIKFGGASIKDSVNIKNVTEIIKKQNYLDSIIIVSAIGKTTNKLELIVKNYVENNKDLQNSLLDLEKFHIKITNDLFPKNHKIHSAINLYFKEIASFLKNNKSPNYNFIYDQIIPFGELLSSCILNEYLNLCGINSKLKDVRNLIKTDSYYRNSNVNWALTQKIISNTKFINSITLTQGFIASNEDNFTTTMGREASDYTASIFAYCLNAKSVTIWKDVDGVLNSDPRYFKKPVLIKKMSYDEAIELAFYGASVIHPKTIQPLQKKEIPLFVRSYINPEITGTCISHSTELNPIVPCYILKKNQILISISSLDFSFTINDNTIYILNLIKEHKIKINLTQNSAISLTLCIEDEYNNFDKLLNKLKSNFKIATSKNVNLYTIRNIEKDTMRKFKKDKSVLIEQIFHNTAQYVVIN